MSDRLREIEAKGTAQATTDDVRWLCHAAERMRDGLEEIVRMGLCEYDSDLAREALRVVGASPDPTPERRS